MAGVKYTASFRPIALGREARKRDKAHTVYCSEESRNFNVPFIDHKKKRKKKKHSHSRILF